MSTNFILPGSVFIDPKDTGCCHACEFKIVRRTADYTAYQNICPRTCTPPVTKIKWKKDKS